ncbi:chitobiase/beta-hexosaminidase C-terminal domain-containing protein [Paenibacillus sp. MBLB4367]|uniref:chitobiase/beta-hexosaminidase C-terminal domain-containing protein n=1 Tax=Paenibacillus sp. MBLB4367 TaxID=3384767 RepID=UPI00390831FA
MKKRIISFSIAALLGLNAVFSFPADAAAKTSADFTDLKDLDAATKARFDAMISAGIFDGVSDTTFGLKDEMNRAQFAKVAALITGIEVNKDLKTSSFGDVKVDDAANGYALPFIEALKTAGVTDGYGEGTYNPAGKVTKEQLATFLVRVLGKDAEAKAKTGNDSTVSNWAQGYVAWALQQKILTNGADGKFGGQASATRDLLLTSAYEAKAQYVSPGKVSIAEAKPVGVKKINVTFNKPIDTTKAGLSITKAEGAQVDWAADKRSATLTFAKNLEEGSYVVTLSGLDAAVVDKTTATVTVIAETVTKIEFTSASNTVASSKAVVIPFKATNQYGEMVQDISKFEVSASVPVSIDLKGMAVIADTSLKSKDERISIYVIHPASGVQASKNYTIEAPEVVPPVVSTPSVVKTPTASVSSGAVTVGTSVYLIDATQGATIYYTTDGNAPSTSSTVYSSPITITNAMTIKAIAVKSGMVNSEVMSVSYTIIQEQVATPTANPSSGAVAAGTSVSLLNATEGATIYYTTDNSDPSPTNGTIYSSPITITNAMTIKAIAVKSGMVNSEVMSVSYTIIQEQVATPTANPSSGAVAAGTSVSLLNATEGATIYYTTDNSNPSPTNGTIYSSPITITNAMTIKAIAVKSGMANSEVMSVSYTITQEQVATPTANPSSGAVAAGTSVSLLNATEGATIYYTTDNSDPSPTNGTIYSSPITITNAMTIKAIAVKSGMANSEVMSVSYTITQEQVATPTANQTDSNGSVLVTLSTTPSDAMIYYTTDGIHDPMTNPQTDPYTVTYNGPFYVETGSTIKAIAVKNGMANSNIMTQQITVVPTPVLSANSLAYIGESNTPGRSLLKLTFSKDVDPTSAANGTYIVWIQSGMNIEPVTIHSAAWGGVGHENEVTLEVDSLASTAAPGTYVSVQVDNVQTTDLSETIESGHNNTGYTV